MKLQRLALYAIFGLLLCKIIRVIALKQSGYYIGGGHGRHNKSACVNPNGIHPHWLQYRDENGYYQAHEEGGRWHPNKYSYWW